MSKGWWVAVFLVMAALLVSAQGQTPLRVLVVDGVNNHDWQAGTSFVKEVLEQSGKFQVDVTTTPERGAPAEEWAKWRPDFSKYAVVVNNFNGGHTKEGLRWPREVETAFVEYVRKGGGVVMFHAANNAFLEWAEYNEMVGLLWREKSFGPGLIVADRELQVVPAGAGLGPGHGPRHDFRVDLFNDEHPITKGLPLFWMHKSEQLTHGQHGPASAMKELKVLTYAWSKDSRRNEPLDWVRSYGKGRVYTTMLGHTWAKEENPNLAVEGFRRLFVRGVEWAATGKVPPYREKR
jgi:uncharacterized protein